MCWFSSIYFNRRFSITEANVVYLNWQVHLVAFHEWFGLFFSLSLFRIINICIMMSIHTQTSHICLHIIRNITYTFISQLQVATNTQALNRKLAVPIDWFIYIKENRESRVLHHKQKETGNSYLFSINHSSPFYW